MAGRGGKKRKRAQTEPTNAQLKAQLDAEKAKVAKQAATLAKLDATIAAIAKRDDIRDGRYFALIDQVFERDAKSNFTRTTTRTATKEFKEVCRSGSQLATKRLFRSDTKERVPAYSLTLDHAKDSEASDAGTATRLSQTSSQSRTSSHLSKKDKIWLQSIFGSESEQRGDIAHLVPAAKEHAQTYWFVTHFLFGYEENRSWGEIRRLIHGTNKKTKNEKVRKIDNTGIKHAVPNKIVLAEQKTNFDQKPHVLIIPICTLKEAKDWNCESYEAIVLIDAFDPQLDGSLEKKRNKELYAITRRTDFGSRDCDTLASKEEVQTAYDLVKKYTHAIIGAQRHFAPQDLKETQIVKDLGNDEFEKQYREIKLSEDLDTLKVRKIKFAAHNEEGGHPAPDPILLATRAAVQLQRRQCITLAAAAEPDDDDDTDDLSALAMDNFLQNRRLLQQFELQQQMVGKEIEF